MTLTPYEYCLLKAVSDLQTDTTFPARSAVGLLTVENAKAEQLDLSDGLLLPALQGFDDEAGRLIRDKLIKQRPGEKPVLVDRSEKSPVAPEPHLEITKEGREALAEYDADR